MLFWIAKYIGFQICYRKKQNVRYTSWHKKTGTFEKPNKIEEIQQKKFIDRNWTIKTCLLKRQ